MWKNIYKYIKQKIPPQIVCIGGRVQSILLFFFFLIFTINKFGADFVFYNFLPVGIFYSFCLVVTRRHYFSLVFSLSFIFGLYEINHLKIENLGMPLVVTDLSVLKLMTVQSSLLAKYIGLSSFLFLIIWAGGIVFLLRKEKTLFSLKLRHSALGFACIFVFIFFVPVKPIFSSIYSKHNGWMPWDPLENVSKNGLAATLLKNGLDLDYKKRVHDDMVITSFLDKYRNSIQEGQADEGVKPDIIMILAESFFDPAIMEGVEDCIFTPVFCELKKESSYGYLDVPTYGGNTIRTEFELLTGIALSNYPQHTFPYLSLVTKPMVSYPRYLKKMGYETIAIHPFKRRFWNRSEVFKQFGFDQFVGEEGFKGAERTGFYIKDQEIPERLFELLRDDTPQFIFVITMENHGPWGNRPNLDEEKVSSVVVPENLHGKAKRQWQEYFYHANNTEIFIKEVFDKVKERTYPTLLFAFGDHLPGLTHVFQQSKFKDGGQPWTQRPPFLVFDNFTEKQTRFDTRTDFVFSQLLERAGLPLREFDSILLYFYEKIQQGTLSAEDKEVLSQFQIRQFNLPI